MYKRDVAVILLGFVSVYVSLQREGTATFFAAWTYTSAGGAGGGAAGGGASVVLPPPVVADLNGDGSAEVVVATADARIVLLALPTGGGAGGTGAGGAGDFAHATVLAQASLLPARVRVAAGRRAVAVAAGSLSPPPEGGSDPHAATVKRVVAVVTEGWHVLVFDHNLRLLWENAIGGDFAHGTHMREVAVHVTHHAMHEKDRGCVLVGGSVEHGDVLTAGGEDALREELYEERVMSRHRSRTGTGAEDVGADGTPGVDGSVDRSRHFNYYAFEGESGEQRWKHESEDFHKEAGSLAHSLTPQHNYRLDAASLEGRHYSEVSCRDFRDSVFEALPHLWVHREDTRFELAHFERHRHRRKGAKGAADAGAASGAPPPGQAAGSIAQRVEQATNPVAGAVARVAGAAGVSGGVATARAPAPPNVVVAHLQEGIEVVHLYTGRTLCKLHLPSPGLHVDLNGDGVLDHVIAHGWNPHTALHGEHHIPRCWATVTSGVPVKENLFNGTICKSLGSGVSRHANKVSNDVSAFHPKLAVAPPAVLPQLNPLAATRARRRTPHDAVFLNSRGEVTLYSPEGKKRWQSRAGASWAPDSDEQKPTLHALVLREGSSAEAVLAVGSSKAVLLSVGGQKISELDLPATPNAPVVVADVNGDGLNDLLVRTPGAVHCYVQHARAGALPFTFLLGALVVAMLAVYASQVHASGGKPTRATD